MSHLKGLRVHTCPVSGLSSFTSTHLTPEVFSAYPEGLVMTGRPRTALICCFACLAEQVIALQGQLFQCAQIRQGTVFDHVAYCSSRRIRSPAEGLCYLKVSDSACGTVSMI